ncbi:MAG: ParA family protein [Candidatus Xenobium sp.]|jgi:chromosome partitioning protein|nr:ParA family protein [Burkholderiales bacterium]
MARILAITNQKGGVGKTTTAVNLGAALARRGRRVLLVDVDPQGNTTSGLGIEKSDLECCIYDAILGSKPVTSVLVGTSIPGLDLVPATLRLAGAEVELVSVLARERRLAKALSPLLESYDFILIDCPPSLGLLTMNALAAAQGVLVPIQCEFYALEGLGQLMQVVDMIREHLNPELAVQGVLLTLHDSRLNLSEQVSEEVRRHFGPLVYHTVIPRNVKLAEAPSFGKPVIEYDLGSRGAQAYLELAREVDENEEARLGTRSVRTPTR